MIAFLASPLSVSINGELIACGGETPGVGTSNPVHLAGNIAVAERGPLPADLYEEVKKRLPLPEAR